MIQQQPQGTARLDARGQRMRIKMRSIEDVGLLHSLPDSRRIPPGSEFSATPSPCGCWKLREAGFSLSPELEDMADDWAAGFDTSDASPYFCSKTDPPPGWWQMDAFSFSFRKVAPWLGMDMGTRKTSTTVYLIEAWHKHGMINWPCFIVCPSVVVSHWEDEFAAYGNQNARVVALDHESKTRGKASVSGSQRRAETVKEECRLWEAAKARGSNPLLVFTINFESVWRKDLERELLKRKWGAIVIDESHRIGANAGQADSTVSKFCAKFGPIGQRRLALTGTPLPNDSGDAFGQLRFLDPAIVGTSRQRFKDRYSTPHQYIKRAVEAWDKNQEELAKKIGSVFFRVNRRDVIADLPDEQDVVISVPLCPKVRRVYNDLVAEMCSKWEQHEITIDNVLVKTLRLQQLTSGILVNDYGEEIIVGKAKHEAALQLLEDMPKDDRVVIFTRFKSELSLLRQMVEKSGRKFFEVSGSVKEHREFCEDDAVGAVLGAQIDSGGTGLNGLQKVCHTAIYLSTGNKPGPYHQSRARLSRSGQRNPMTFYHLHVPGSIDKHIAKTFQRKRDTVEEMMIKVAVAKEVMAELGTL